MQKDTAKIVEELGLCSDFKTFYDENKEYMVDRSLPELLDVNLCITYVGDLSPLLSCRKLERIWIGQQTQDHCSKESLQALLEAFPDAEYDLLSVSCTNRGWREHPRFFAFQEMFKTNTAVAPFLPED